MRRTVLAGLATAAALAVLPLVPAAAAAPVTEVQVTLADPLLVQPVEVQVTAVDADGDAVPFTGTVTLTTGRTSVSGLVTADGSGAGVLDLPTGALSGGWASVHAVVRGGGRTAAVTLDRFVDVPAGLAIGGFGCAALTAAGGDVRFAVTAMNGAPVPYPATAQRVQLAYVPELPPARMVDADGAALATSGRMTVRAGARTVAVVAVPRAVRPLVFAVHWSARVTGRFVPGAYTATLDLTDAHGRAIQAVRTVRLVRPGVTPCR